MSTLPERCDVLVVGAGPAGSAAAIASAQSGARTLLVEREALPRPKPCGCCLRRRAQRELELLGAADLLDGVPRIRRIRLAARGRERTLPAPLMSACSRERLDAGLARRASAVGAVVRTRLPARPGALRSEGRVVTLGRGEDRRDVLARVVVAADGLRGAFAAVAAPETPRRRVPQWIGAGTVRAAPAGQGTPAVGTLEMACHRFGYAGAVRLEDGAIDIAAALDPAWVRRVGSIEAAVHRIRAEAGLDPLERFDPADRSRSTWRGTPTLARARGAAALRLLVAGDALGYREPFTGEGIGWALAGGRAMGALAAHAARHGWSMRTERSARATARRLLAAQRACGVLGAVARRPGVLSSILAAVPARRGHVAPAPAVPPCREIMP